MHPFNLSDRPHRMPSELHLLLGTGPHEKEERLQGFEPIAASRLLRRSSRCFGRSSGFLEAPPARGESQAIRRLDILFAF